MYAIRSYYAVWRLFKENIGLNQINLDWHLLSYSAKWLGSEEVFYNDQRYQEDITNDTNLLLDLWALLDEADIVITQNGKKFDIPKIKSRMIINVITSYSIHYTKLYDIWRFKNIF